MRVAVIIPDRGDRPLFLENCKRMVKAQTLQPFTIHIDKKQAIDDKVDIVPRIRRMYSYVNSVCSDVVAIMENDDWYAPDYLDTMVREWEKADRPDLFGTAFTIYHHMRTHKFFVMEHYQRASLMNTLIRPGLNFKWPVDNEPYLDMALWEDIPFRRVYTPKKIISIGMKHGVGLTGAWGHRLDPGMSERYDNIIPSRLSYLGNYADGLDLLTKNLDEESLKFYTTYDFN